MNPGPERLARVRARMAEARVDTLLLSVGPDLPWLVGYEAMPLERLTMLVVRADGDPVLVVPRLEAPRVDDHGLVAVETWDETDDPVARVAALAAGAERVAVGDHTWSRFLLALQAALPDARFGPANAVLAPLRAVKDASEIAALEQAGAAVDTVAVALRDVAFAGRREIDVHREIVDRLLDVGHDRVNFAIVAAGENAASPHHEPGPRTIVDGDIVHCDFGGTRAGYCSDITRMFHVGEPPAEVRDAYAVLVEAQEAGVQAVTVGTPCEAADAAARAVITAAGYGEQFVHRTGHGIGTEAHEDPYLVAGNAAPLVAGNAVSVEPGIYVAGRWGMRLEDIVVATDAGPLRCNHAPRDLAVVG